MNFFGGEQKPQGPDPLFAGEAYMHSSDVLIGLPFYIVSLKYCFIV